MTTKDYRVTVKVRNNRILKAIEECGGQAGGKWCESAGLSYSLINDLINMTASPLTESGELRKCASDLCEAVGKLPDELWSNDQLRPLESNFSELEMTHEQVVAMLPADDRSYLQDFSAVEDEQTASAMSLVLETLTKSEQLVLRMRFYKDANLDECGRVLGVSRERIRQIEAKAMRKLRHPSRASMMVGLTDNQRIDERFAENAARYEETRNQT